MLRVLSSKGRAASDAHATGKLNFGSIKNFTACYLMDLFEIAIHFLIKFYTINLVNALALLMFAINRKSYGKSQRLRFFIQSGMGACFLADFFVLDFLRGFFIVFLDVVFFFAVLLD